MNNTLTKTIASFLTVAMLATGTTFLTSCKAKTTAADATVVLTKETVAVPKSLPSVATGTMTINGENVSAAEYDFFYYSTYNNYAQYASSGYVPTVAADGTFDLSAACPMPGYETGTWGDFIKADSLKQLQQVHIFAYDASQTGMTLTAEDQTVIDNFYTSLQTAADKYSITLDQYLATQYGDKTSKAELDPVLSRYLLATEYRTQLDKTYTFTDIELQAYYTANSANYKNTDLPSVRHILFLAPKSAEGYTDATPDEIAKAKALAESTLAKITSYDDMVKIGDAAYADGSAYESAEYAVAVGAMVPEFEAWAYDAARKPGDMGIVQSEYGFHVMYFVKTEKDWMADAIKSLTSDKDSAYIDAQSKLPQFELKIT